MSKKCLHCGSEALEDLALDPSVFDNVSETILNFTGDVINPFRLVKRVSSISKRLSREAQRKREGKKVTFGKFLRCKTCDKTTVQCEKCHHSFKIPKGTLADMIINIYSCPACKEELFI